MAPVLIKEVTRRVNLNGIWQALYTAGVYIPKPISTCRYYHRSLNPKKLIDVGFSSLTRNMNMSRTVKLYRLPETTLIEGLRPLDPKKDLKQVALLMKEHMKKFDLAPQFSNEELAHWLTPIPDVISSYVVEVTILNSSMITVLFYNMILFFRNLKVEVIRKKLSLSLASIFCLRL